MQVRIRVPHGRPLHLPRGRNRQLALAFGGLLMPISLMAYVMAFWRLANDMGLLGEFGAGGVFSHWQIWMGLGAMSHIGAYSLNRYGRGGELEVPRVLTPFPGRPHDAGNRKQA